MTSVSKLHYKNTNPVSFSTREFSFKHVHISRDVFTSCSASRCQKPTDGENPLDVSLRGRCSHRSCATGVVKLWYWCFCWDQKSSASAGGVGPMPINWMTVIVSVFEIFRLKDRKLLILTTPPLFDAPLGVTPFEFCDKIWYQKTRIGRLPDRFYTIPARDGRTDGQTSLKLVSPNENLLYMRKFRSLNNSMCSRV